MQLLGIHSRYDGKAFAMEKPIETPEVGDVIYVDTELFMGHGKDDFCGGRATVTAIHAGKSPFVEIAQNPGRSYSWAYLAGLQVALAEKFGDAWAFPDPDTRPEFNEDWH
jgi:hypothetical protein